jgi:hypothetical protein
LLVTNRLLFYGEELLASRPTPKLEDHPLSAVRECLFNIFAAALQKTFLLTMVFSFSKFRISSVVFKSQWYGRSCNTVKPFPAKVLQISELVPLHHKACLFDEQGWNLMQELKYSVNKV